MLCLDGVDGAGKSTQLEQLVGWLRGSVREVVVCRDPGGTSGGEAIRELLLAPESQLGARCEMLLYMASRSQLLEEVIGPALQRGSVVLTDRFLTSTIVYQGHAGGLDPEMVRRIGLEATGGLVPDWTGILDLAVEESIRRRSGPADRIELRPIDYHRRVREGFLFEAKRDPDHFSILDATLGPEEIQAAIRGELSRRFADQLTAQPRPLQ